MSRRPPAALLLMLCAALAADAAEPVRSAVVVKLRSEGPAAVNDCAESAWRAGRSLAASSADGSDSFDVLERTLRVRSVRALFRRPDGRPFAQQRQHWQERVRAKRTTARGAPSAVAALPDLSAVYRMELAAGEDPVAAAERLAADPHVAWAQPEHAMRFDFVPNDPFFFSSGSWGQPYADLWGLMRIRAPEAWNLTRGAGSVIAVVDSGLDYRHPDIADNVWVNPGEDLDGDGRATDADRNGVDDDGNGLVDDLIGYDFFPPGDADPFDDNGHGTHVSGTAAAVGGNGIGILGVAPEDHVMVLKGFPASGSGLDSSLAQGIVYAAENGADVINASWSCSTRCPTNPVIDEAVELAHGLGTVFVTSAGNSGDDVVFQSPKNRRVAIAVAASQDDDSLAPFSSRGFLLGVAAPGAGRFIGPDPFANEAILSLLSSGAPDLFSAGIRVGDAFVRLAGTSMSAPHVAGVVALVRSLHPDATPEEIRALLRATARDAGPPGHDPGYGAGIVDAFAAVTGSAPRVRGELEAPAAAAILDPRAGPIALRGDAVGDDFASYALAFGHGLEPTSWTPIPAASGGPIENGLLGRWDASALTDGPYVLRLEVTSTGGAVVQEFAPLSLERVRPVPVSPEGPPAQAPDVSGDLVVYESERPVDVLGGTDVDVFATDLRSGRELALAPAPGRQQRPRISGRRIAYRDLGIEPGGEIHTCKLDVGFLRCDDLAVAVGPATRSDPVVSGPRIFWTERGPDGDHPLLCDLGPGGRSCRVEPVAVRPDTQLELEVSGARLVWHEPAGGLVVSCTLDPKTGACPAVIVNAENFAQFAPVVSGRLFAWEQFAFWPGFGIGNRVNVCRLDPASGSCPVTFAGPPVTGSPAPDVAGDTVVWGSDATGEPSAIYFCEHDRFTNTCPAQRLTGSAAGARNPAIDGRRVVFEDERDGPVRIYTTVLPDLRVIGRQHVRAGQWLLLAVEGLVPSGGGMALSASLPDGTPVERIGMRFVPFGTRAALLLWRPGRDAVGTQLVRLEGRTAEGLFTRDTLELRVDASGHHP